MSFMDMRRHIGGKLRKDWNDDASIIKPLLLSGAALIAASAVGASAPEILASMSLDFWR